MNELWIIGLLGGGASAAVGGPLLLRNRSRSAEWTIDQLIGLWLLGAAAAMLLIGVRHGGLLAHGWDLVVEHVTDATSLVAWTTLVSITRRMTGLEPLVRGGPMWHLALPGLYTLFVLFTGIPDVPFLWLLPAALCSLTAIGWLWRRASSTGHPTARQAGAVFAMAAVWCGAQSVRSLFPRVAELREIVPLVMTLSTFAIAFALTGTHVLRPDSTDSANSGRPPEPRSQLARYVKSSLTARDADSLISTLDARMDANGWYREPDLSLATLASRLAVSPQTLSQALNQRRGVTLMQYVAERRLREARRLLEDPAYDCITIDGIAQRSGFASRSAFYKTFREAAGVTPTRYRAATRQSQALDTEPVLDT